MARISVFARLIFLGVFTTILLSVAAWGTATEVVLYDFCQLSGCADGEYPNGELVFDAAGNLYGAALYGGAKGGGVVFELSPSPNGWTETVLYSFCSQPSCADGQMPEGALIFDSLGNIYGTTVYGGAYGAGTVYELSPSEGGWSETVLYSFCPFPCIANPIAGVAMDKTGNLYGPTYYNDIFELSPGGEGWTESTLYEAGSNTPAGVSFDAAGNLYGVANGNGGDYPGGYVLELSPFESSWKLSVPYVFNENKAGKYADGYAPNSTPVFDKKGNLYGTTRYDPALGSTVGGTVFKLTPGKKKWAFKLLHTFTGKKGDGDLPLGPLTVDSSGNVFGTASYGGSDVACNGGTGCGIVYELSPTGAKYTETVLWTFSWANGAHPMSGVILDKAGNLYGTTYFGGTAYGGSGTVFEVIP